MVVPAASAGRRSTVLGCESSTFCIQSVEITQHLAPMVNRLLNPIRRWPALEAVLSRLAGGLPAASELRPAAPLVAIAPPTFEMHFMPLHAQARVDAMGIMVPEDAQPTLQGGEACH